MAGILKNKKTIRIGIHQPGYHRYCGYFYKMYKSDIFISLDTVQYVPREWQNRQLFFNGKNYKWLTVSVNRGREPIKDKIIVYPEVLKDHWEYIKYIYRKTPFFSQYSALLAPIYLEQRWTTLSNLCHALTHVAKDILEIRTKFVIDSQNKYINRGYKKADVLIDAIKRSVNISSYSKVIYLPRNHPIPKDFYLNKRYGNSTIREIDKFKQAGIQTQTYNFHHPTYRQFQNSNDSQFVSNLSIFDLIFNCGPDSLEILRSGGDDDYRI